MLLRFLLAFNPRLIPANWLAPTKFGRRSNYTTIDVINCPTSKINRLQPRFQGWLTDCNLQFPRIADVTQQRPAWKRENGRKIWTLQTGK